MIRISPKIMCQHFMIEENSFIFKRLRSVWHNTFARPISENYEPVEIGWSDHPLEDGECYSKGAPYVIVPASEDAISCPTISELDRRSKRFIDDSGEGSAHG